MWVTVYEARFGSILYYEPTRLKSVRWKSYWRFKTKCLVFLWNYSAGIVPKLMEAVTVTATLLIKREAEHQHCQLEQSEMVFWAITAGITLSAVALILIFNMWCKLVGIFTSMSHTTLKRCTKKVVPIVNKVSCHTYTDVMKKRGFASAIITLHKTKQIVVV